MFVHFFFLCYNLFLQYPQVIFLSEWPKATICCDVAFLLCFKEEKKCLFKAVLYVLPKNQPTHKNKYLTTHHKGKVEKKQIYGMFTRIHILYNLWQFREENLNLLCNKDIFFE